MAWGKRRKIIYHESVVSTASCAKCLANVRWINAGDGIFPEELLGEADGLRDRLQTEEGEPKDYAWPLTGPEGEIASLMNMVSNHEIDFNFEPEDFPTLKHHGEGYHTRCLSESSVIQSELC